MYMVNTYIWRLFLFGVIGGKKSPKYLKVVYSKVETMPNVK